MNYAMNPQDFKLSLIDRAIEIVQKEELPYAYSCFAIARAISEAKGEVFDYEHYSLESKIYESFAVKFFQSIPEEDRGRVQASSGFMPWWWSMDTDEANGRQVEARVAFMRMFRAWLVEKGAT